MRSANRFSSNKQLSFVTGIMPCFSSPCPCDGKDTPATATAVAVAGRFRSVDGMVIARMVRSILALIKCSRTCNNNTTAANDDDDDDVVDDVVDDDAATPTTSPGRCLFPGTSFDGCCKPSPDPCPSPCPSPGPPCAVAA